KFSARPEDRLAAHLHIAQRAVGELARHEHIVERLPCVEDRAMRVPAAFDFEAAAFPALHADQPRAQAFIAASHVAAFQPRETVAGVLLPVPVGGERGQAAKARFAFAHRLLGRRALEVLADHRGDDLQRLLHALVRRAQAPARYLEHRRDTPGRRDRHGDEGFRRVDRGAGPMRVAAQPLPALVDFPDFGALPAFGLAERLQRAAERFLRGRIFGEAPSDAVLQPQQPLDPLLRRDVAPDAAIAGEAALGVEHRLAGGEHIAAVAVVELAPHQDIAERLAGFEQRAMRVPAALDLDAGLP